MALQDKRSANIDMNIRRRLYMYKVLDPGKERRSINVLDHVCFSHVTDLEGNPLDLYMTLMLQNGNSEMRLAGICAERYS